MIFWIAKIFCFLPLWLMHPIFIKGKKNVPKGKVIFSCNHLSNWDIVSFLLAYEKRIYTMGKKELFKKKFPAFFLKKFGAFPVDREGNDLQAIRTCMKILKDEKRLVIFPEGKRLKDMSKELGELKSGLVMIAIKTHSPIVPVWIEKKAKLFRKSVYHMGKPFELSEFYGQKCDEATLAKANAILRDKMLEVKANILAKKTKKK